MKTQTGFTLIEIIVSLLLVGFLALFAGMGIVTFTKGYIFARENAHMAQKANMALQRINRELRELIDVSAASSTAVTIGSPAGTRIIGLDDEKIKIAEAGVSLADGNILIDDVGGLTLSYYKGAEPWAQGMDIRLLSAIEVKFTLKRADSGEDPLEFSTTIHPRNNNNTGGASAAAEPPSQYDYSCFVSAASCGHLRMITLFFMILAGFIAWRTADFFGKKRRCSRARRQNGSILVGLIVTMLIISVLGASLLPLTSSSIFTLLETNTSTRAYFLAESGLRFAGSEYLAADEKDRNDTLEKLLHNKDFTLAENEGKFNIKVYPYYFVPTSDPYGTTTLSTNVPGGYPEAMVLSSGRLKIDDQVFTYTAANRIDSAVTFTISEVINKHIDIMDKENLPVVLPAALSSNWQQTVGKGGDLNYQADSAEAFPIRNGIIRINDHPYAYKMKDSVNNKLAGIHDPNDPDMTSFVVEANSDIVLQKFAEVHSKGTYGLGEAAASKKLVYFVPLPTSTPEKTVFADTFEDQSNWQSAAGTHRTQEIGGDKALKVTGAISLPGAPKASLVTLQSTEAKKNLQNAYKSADDTLNYDAQVKVGFDATPVPVQGFDPSPLPTYYVAGISFRLDENSNSYGLSFMRGSNSIPSPYDNIDNAMVPVDYKNLIILWQQTNNGTSRTWLAYKNLENWNFSDNVETGVNGWTSDGLWHIVSHRSQSASQAWWYGRDATGTYNTGERNFGNLVSPVINLCNAISPVLTFWSWYETQTVNPNTYDYKYVDIYDGTQWNNGVYQIRYPMIPMETWVQITIDLGAYTGKMINLRFRFDTRDALYNDQEGWYIDDITVSGKTLFNEATLLVRVKEAASITFTGGDLNTGVDPIQDGDRIVGQTSGARATVDGDPILASGSWVSGDAAGTLILSNVSETADFQPGETLYASGSWATAIVQECREKDNFIRAYYGLPNSCGTSDNDPFNDERRAHVRGQSLQWPPDAIGEWEADNDYFTLIQWDGYNPNIVYEPTESPTEPGTEKVYSLDEPNVIIRTNVLTTSETWTGDRPELGLHTFGHGSTNVYFDDFGLQTEITQVARTAPVQQ